MSLITKEEVLKIARLSRIAIHDNEVEELTKQLESLLAYAARVNEFVEVQPGALPYNVNVFREDVVVLSDPARIKSEAPDIEEDYFVVPAILEQE